MKSMLNQCQFQNSSRVVFLKRSNNSELNLQRYLDMFVKRSVGNVYVKHAQLQLIILNNLVQHLKYSKCKVFACMSTMCIPVCYQIPKAVFQSFNPY